MNNNEQAFLKYWDKFITKVKGKLMTSAKNQSLEYSFIKLIVSEAALDWDVDTTECGKWLMAYSSENPDKSKLVRKILLEDMTVTPIEKKEISSVISYVVPAVGAIAGFGISTAFNGGVLVKAISTIVPAAVLYPTSAQAIKTINKNVNDNLLTQYIEQLDKYKVSVLSVLGD